MNKWLDRQTRRMRVLLVWSSGLVTLVLWGDTGVLLVTLPFLVLASWRVGYLLMLEFKQGLKPSSRDPFSRRRRWL